MKRCLSTLAVALLLVMLSGCGASFGPQAKYGITFYCPGAGNVDMGDAGIREGLERAGYRGQVVRVTWSLSFNPAIDQTVKPIARLGAARLAGQIQDYIDRYPDREVNLIGLSAGSGVAIWALEALKPGYRVDNVVLLASSLSSDYDVSEALRHVNGQVYNYYSPNDAVLTGPMKVVGTIDGKLLADGAGSVGLHSPNNSNRVVNIRWRPEFRRYGYNGGHIDGTAPSFVHHYVARHIVTPRSAGLLDTAASRRLLRALRGQIDDTVALVDDAGDEPTAVVAQATPPPPVAPARPLPPRRSVPPPPRDTRPAELARLIKVLSGETTPAAEPPETTPATIAHARGSVRPLADDPTTSEEIVSLDLWRLRQKAAAIRQEIMTRAEPQD